MRFPGIGKPASIGFLQTGCRYMDVVYRYQSSVVGATGLCICNWDMSRRKVPVCLLPWCQPTCSMWETQNYRWVWRKMLFPYIFTYLVEPLVLLKLWGVVGELRCLSTWWLGLTNTRLGRRDELGYMSALTADVLLRVSWESFFFPATPLFPRIRKFWFWIS